MNFIVSELNEGCFDCFGLACSLRQPNVPDCVMVFLFFMEFRLFKLLYKFVFFKIIKLFFFKA